ncbi:MAG TPA: 23S rRNA (pseudouridine(1915)-N(3))-methyltransferase RlmH, partial [Stellaceae bacterium]|nr:23S rRNA (pseudouridine(1915)-N(3))-methyltransferase RlmH [Stellaceae bacterium]
MRLHILAIGRLRHGPLYDLQSNYAGRIVPPAAIVELEEKRRLPPPELKTREAELTLAALPAGARLVALDQRGAEWSSRELADRLRTWRDSGIGA